MRIRRAILDPFEREVLCPICGAPGHACQTWLQQPSVTLEPPLRATRKPPARTATTPKPEPSKE
jgi:hypothetical protein